MDTSEFSRTEQRLIALWEEHTRLEFETRDAVATVATMSDDNYVNHVPVMTGGRGKKEMLDFYGNHFIPKMPADTETRLVCRTVGQERVIDELVMSFTHDIEMDWMTPGIPPTGRKVEVPLVVVVQTRSEKIVCERIYWDQASVLLQLGVLEAGDLPIAGVESARKAVNVKMPSNELIRRASR
jgi:carboxymethylenebutenolidase